MSSNKYDYLTHVCKGRTDWKIKVRIIREWRGRTATGELFKNYNMLLLDAKVRFENPCFNVFVNIHESLNLIQAF